MIAALLAKLGAKVGVWAAAIGTLAAAVFGLIAYGKHKQRATDLADAAQQALAQANAQTKAVQDAATVRQEVDSETAKLPYAPAQRVGSAAAGTAAAKLRDDWRRT